MFGRMAGSMKVSGCRTKCTARVLSAGQMDAPILGTTCIKKKRATENSVGPTVAATRGTGETVSRTGRACTAIGTGWRGRVSGRTVKRLDGSNDSMDLFYCPNLLEL